VATTTLSDNPLLAELCGTLSRTLRELPYPEYQRQVHLALTELVAHHRDHLTPDVVDLAAKTLEQLDPLPSPVPAEIDAIADLWETVLANARPPSRNVGGLWYALSEVRLHLSSRNHVLASDLCHALVSDVIVPVTPAMDLANPHVNPSLAIADPESPEVKMLYHLIERARSAGERA
jgi:hypothetical protein